MLTRAGRAPDVPADLVDAVDTVPLVDHHVHGALTGSPSRQAFGDALNEGDTDPLPADADPFDSQLGFAIRAWCAPLLGLPRHASADEYWRARSALPEAELNRLFLGAAGVSDWLLDTGPVTTRGTSLLDLEAMAAASGGSAHEVVRLEPILEHLASVGTSPAAVVDAFRNALGRAGSAAVGAKTVAAYRCGFGVELGRPSDRAVGAAYERWLSRTGTGPPRSDDPVLIAFGIHEALELGMPVQFHVGLGDRDLKLDQANPLLLTDFLRSAEARRAPILLLHCYPFEREAGYLTQAFANVFLDVGLAVNHLGARSTALVGRAFELAPFAKILYSSDGCGPAELHFLGAGLWRVGLTRVLGGFVLEDDWSLEDAVRVATATSRDNAFRAYPRLAERIQR